MASRPAASRRKRLVVLSSGVAALALAGGVAAQFTASTTSAPQEIGTGSVALSLLDTTDTVWTQPISNFAAGDTMERFVDLKNSGTLDLRGIAVSQTNDLGDLIEDPAGIDITLTSCDVAWNGVTGVCTGTEKIVFSSTDVSDWTDMGATVEDRFINLDAASYDNFKAGSLSHLKVSTHIAAATPNEDQNKSGSITYTFKGLQRQGNLASSDASIGGDSPTSGNTGGNAGGNGGGASTPINSSLAAPDVRAGSDWGNPVTVIGQFSGMDASETLTGYNFKIIDADGATVGTSSADVDMSNDDGSAYAQRSVFSDNGGSDAAQGCAQAVYGAEASDWVCTSIEVWGAS